MDRRINDKAAEQRRCEIQSGKRLSGPKLVIAIVAVYVVAIGAGMGVYKLFSG